MRPGLASVGVVLMACSTVGCQRPAWFGWFEPEPIQPARPTHLTPETHGFRMAEPGFGADVPNLRKVTPGQEMFGDQARGQTPKGR